MHTEIIFYVYTHNATYVYWCWCMYGWMGRKVYKYAHTHTTHTHTHTHTHTTHTHTHAHTIVVGGRFENSKIFVQIFVLPNVCDHGYYSVSTVGPHMSGPQRSSIVSHLSDIHMIIFIKNFKVNILCQSHAFKDTVYGKFQVMNTSRSQGIQINEVPLYMY